MLGVVEALRSYVPGWIACFRLSQTPRVWRTLDEWMRHRLRAIQLMHRQREVSMYRESKALDASETVARRAAGSARSWWRNGCRLIDSILTIAYFDRLGGPRHS